MVYKVEQCGRLGAQELMQKKKKKKRPQDGEAEARLQCNKGKACRFKRSCSGGEEDAVSSVILLLACLVCSPPSMKRSIDPHHCNT
ncbi:hypothetical protein C4D60_Mb08t08260 [Musa balbisiana]|uniref:Uncharacterized protein n=1 Tax=Musa balbisiana TaxID=52838 RepID=A0A4V4H8S8_MUSBA|nr:hypothetical protein C4D60_Mb08t08260 [Musa balbisiana]